jgi:Spy/CpxP family protein refolding chaperone
MAFAADRHGYPGPMHVLELKTELGLTAEQEARVRDLHARVMAQRERSVRLIQAEERLEQLFAAGTATEAAVRAAVAEVERARTEVRLVHLLAHLETRDLLTPAQRATYHRARWS